MSDESHKIFSSWTFVISLMSSTMKGVFESSKLKAADLIRSFNILFLLSFVASICIDNPELFKFVKDIIERSGWYSVSSAYIMYSEFLRRIFIYYLQLLLSSYPATFRPGGHQPSSFSHLLFWHDLIKLLLLLVHVMAPHLWLTWLLCCQIIFILFYQISILAKKTALGIFLFSWSTTYPFHKL